MYFSQSYSVTLDLVGIVDREVQVGVIVAATATALRKRIVFGFVKCVRISRFLEALRNNSVRN